MSNMKLLISILILCVFISIGSASAMSNIDSTDNIITSDNYTDELKSIDSMNSNLSENEDTNSIDKLSAVESLNSANQSISDDSNSEILSSSDDSSDNILSSSSVSNSNKPHTYKINGYTFTVSASQYAKIKKAINMGKKQDWLDNGFTFKVKTNKFITKKVLVSKKTYTKKVRYEGLTKYPYRGINLANLKKYYKKGWKKTFYSYESAKHSKKYLGYNYAILKKTVKKYKTVRMRVYAKITYQGWSKYDDGPHYYYPWVDFNAMKKGYPTRYLSMADITK